MTRARRFCGRRCRCGTSRASWPARGHWCSKNTVARLLAADGFSLQGNSRTIEGRRHPDRDAQFRYINERATEFLAAGDPVISVDTKKKEPVGQYANHGRSWRPKGKPVRVRDHDFPDPKEGIAIPYGVYDVGANAGFVNVGTDHDTAGVRGRVDPPLVGHGRQGALPGRRGGC